MFARSFLSVGIDDIAAHLPHIYLKIEDLSIARNIEYAKLNKGLADMGLSVDTDLDVPYQNVVGFLIRLESFKLFIKNILNPNTDGQTTDTEPTV